MQKFLRVNGKIIPYAEIHALPEDERIKAIADFHHQNPGIISGVVTDSDPADKALRYAEKLKAKGLLVLDVTPGPTAGSTVIRVMRPGGVN